MQKLEIIYKLNSQTATNIWSRLAPILDKFETRNKIFSYSGEISLSQLISELKSKADKRFNFETERFIFLLCPVTNSNQILLNIEIKEAYANWWQEWIQSLYSLNGFIQAWVVDSDYNRWENVTDPRFYDIHGKSYEHLKLKSNGLPPPLEELELDISKNLGLRKICNGYVEAIGAHMWLSKDFLKLIGKDLEELSRASIFQTDKFRIDEVLPNLYQISCSAQIFKDINTENEQRQLRKLLYA